MMLKSCFSVLLLGLFLMQSVHAASMEQEIQHLLDFVEKSGCIFERNGDEYPPLEARAHIERKYNYIKGKVTRTEDFIKYAASESSMSGRQYHATCEGKTITSKEWLIRELERYRAGS